MRAARLRGGTARLCRGPGAFEIGRSTRSTSAAGVAILRVRSLDTLHLDFSDMVFWPALRERKALGAIDPVRATQATRRLLRDFFD
jgi:hypothetical protein